MARRTGQFRSVARYGVLAGVVLAASATALGDPAFSGERCAARSVIGEFAGGNARDIVLGDGAAAVLGPSLGVVDLTDESNPQPIRAVFLPNTEFQRIERHENRLYGVGEGICILSYADPLEPVSLGFFDPPLPMYAGDVSGLFAVVSTEPSTDLGVPYALQLVNLTSPVRPSVVDEVGFETKIVGMEFDGSLVYAVTESGRLLTLSMSPGNRFAIESDVAGPPSWEGGSIEQDGNRLIVTTDEIRIYDISDPLAPELDRARFFPGSELRGAVLRDGRLYALTVPGGIEVLDANDPELPRVGRYLRGDDLLAVDERDGLVGVVRSNGGAILRIDEPVVPAFATTPTIGEVASLDVSEGFAYLAANEGLQIIDVRQPRSPVPLGSLPSLTLSTDVAVLGDRAYVASEGQVVVVDVSDPQNPMVTANLGSYSGDTPLSRDGSVLAVRSAPTALDLYEADGRGDVRSGATIPFQSELADFVIQGSRLYALESAGLSVYSLSNTDAPQLLGFTDGYTGDGLLAPDGDTLYVTSGIQNQSGFLYTLDVSNPAAITELFRRFLAEAPTSMDAYRDRLWLARGTPELQAVLDEGLFNDIAVGTSADVNALQIVGGVAYCGVGTAGLDIIAIGDCPRCPAALASPDDVLDLQDLVLFIELFLANASLADSDRNGLFDLADLVMFVADFSAGCD